MAFCMLESLADKLFVFAIFVASMVFIYLMRITDIGVLDDFIKPP
jgi:hypothetical protein